MSKQYYKCIRNGQVDIWHCTSNTMSTTLSRSYNLILPLGTRKPKNVSRETIKEG